MAGFFGLTESGFFAPQRGIASVEAASAGSLANRSLHFGRDDDVNFKMQSDPRYGMFKRAVEEGIADIPERQQNKENSFYYSDMGDYGVSGTGRFLPNTACKLRQRAGSVGDL